MSEETRAANPLGTAPIRGLIWKFALPGMVSQLVTAVYNIVDQIFVGWGIGDLGIAATTVAFPLATITTALAVWFGVGTASKYSLLLGEKKPEEAKGVIGTGLILLAGSGLLVALAGLVFLRPLLYFFGATDLIMPYAQPYGLIICLGIPFGVFSTGVSFYIRADGSPNYSSALLLSGAIFNIIFDPIFLFCFDMGIEGIALATSLGQVLSSVLALYYLLKKNKMITLRRSDLRLRLPNVKAVCTLGMASFTTHSLNTVVQIISLNALKHYGALSLYGSEIPLAAAGAVGKTMTVLLSTVIGISLGCQPIYGFNYGAKQFSRVKETYLRALRYGTAIAVGAYLILQLFPRAILSVFGSADPLFYAFGTRYIRVFLFMIFANALQPVTSTFFTAIGRASMGFWMALVRQGLLLIPLLLLLPRLFGIDGVFFAGPVSDGLAAVMVAFVAVRGVRGLNRLQAEQSGPPADLEAGQ